MAPAEVARFDSVVWGARGTSAEGALLVSNAGLAWENKRVRCSASAAGRRGEARRGLRVARPGCALPALRCPARGSATRPSLAMTSCI